MSEYLEFINANLWNLIWVLTAVVTGGLFFSTLMPSAVTKMSVPATAIAKLVSSNSALLIDIREKNEFVQGHIPGSKNAPAGTISQYCASNKIDKEQVMVLICSNGTRSTQVFKKLLTEGYKKVHILQMGIEGWRSANFPIIKK